MKTVLMHTSFGLWPMLEYELDIAQKEMDAGNREWARETRSACVPN